MAMVASLFVLIERLKSEKRGLRKKAVSDLKKKLSEEPDKRHFIRGLTVVTVSPGWFTPAPLCVVWLLCVVFFFHRYKQLNTPFSNLVCASKKIIKSTIACTEVKSSPWRWSTACPLIYFLPLNIGNFIWRHAFIRSVWIFVILYNKYTFQPRPSKNESVCLSVIS